MKKLLLSLAFIGLVSFGKAQQLSFSETYGFYPSQAFAIINTFDNKFIIAGAQNGPLVFKIDSLGNTIWAKSIGSTNNYTGFYNLIETRDSCYVVVGSIFNTIDSTYDILCVKINSNGDTLWTQDIDMGYDDYALSVQQTFDGGYILAGYSSLNTSPLSLIAVVKLNANGNLIWGNTYFGSNYNNIAYSVKQLPDSGYVVTGYVDSLSASDGRAFLMKLTPTGNISWTKKQLIFSTYYALCSDVIVSNNNLICFLGINKTNNNNIIMKTDFSGNVLWSKYYNTCGGAGVSPLPKLHSISDSVYIFESENSFTKIDSAGNPLLGVFSGEINDVLETTDKGFMILGNAVEVTKEISTISGGISITVMKTDSLGYGSEVCSNECSVPSPTQGSITLAAVTFTVFATAISVSSHPIVKNTSLDVMNGCVFGGIDESKDKENSIAVFPNPVTDILQIQTDIPIKNIEVTDIAGRLLYTTNAKIINCSSFASGVYFIRATTVNGVVVKRFIKE
jgi:hypothetical protein